MRFVILHGTDADNKSHWFDWLKNELESLGHQVWAPNLPDAEEPNLHKYNEFLMNSGFDFNEVVMIGHSSGAVAINGLLQVLPDNVKIKSTYYLGIFKGDLGWSKLKGVDINFDYKKIKSKADKLYVLHSDNDPHCPLEDAKWISQQLGADFILMPGMHHFSTGQDPRFSKFPELLEIIKEREFING